MKRIFFITILLLVSFFGFSQKIKRKSDVIIVDKVEYLKIKEDKVSKNSYVISNLKGEDILYIRYSTFYDPSTITYFNGQKTSGYVGYFEVLSADLNTLYFDTNLVGSPFNSFHTEKVFNILYNGEAVNSDGTLNIEKLTILSKKIGFEYTERKEKLEGNTSTTTIIREEPASKSGVNFSIGR